MAETKQRNREGIKQRLANLQDKLQQEEQEAQRLEGELEGHLKEIEKALGTRDLDEASKILAEQENELAEQREQLNNEVAAVEAKMPDGGEEGGE